MTCGDISLLQMPEMQHRSEEEWQRCWRILLHQMNRSFALDCDDVAESFFDVKFDKDYR